jgi:biopolymer transport protein TolR
MGMQVGGSKGGVFVEMNVVPLIDILLVMLVIFMIIPHHQKGLDAYLPQPAPQPLPVAPEPDVIVIEVLSSGELRINQQPVAWDELANRLEAIFKERASKLAFIRGDALVEFAQVARVVDVMHGSGISVGLLTPGLEQSR